MPPVVVIGYQSPGLVCRLRLSNSWNLQAHPLGEPLCDSWPDWAAPEFRGDAASVEMVLVGSARQLLEARRIFPRARIVQLAHQGHLHRLPVWYEATNILTFSFGNRLQLLRHMEFSNIFVVRPFFEPASIWKWQKNEVWTMMSNPELRKPLDNAGPNQILAMAAGNGIRHTWYGAGRPVGTLDEIGKRRVMSSCAAYLTVLRPKSGVGLAEHECMAAGVPVVGAAFADALDAAQDLPLWDYWDFDYIVEDLLRAAHHKSWAQRFSEMGLEYISSHCNLSAMDESIQLLLDTCPYTRPSDVRSLVAWWMTRDDKTGQKQVRSKPR